MADINCYMSCLRRVRSIIPIGLKTELKELFTLAVPLFLSYIMVYMIGFVSSVFCGHLGRTELDGVALAVAVFNVAGVAVGWGLSSALATLISQTYGSGNLQRIGVIVQRGLLILFLACFPCWAILINTETILLAVKQSPEVARLSQMYVKINMPALPAVFTFAIESTYLQNQGIMWPLVIIGAIANVLNALINYILVFVLGLGVAGSAAANCVSQYTMAILLFIYIRWKGLHKDTWHGWSMDCLQEWDTFLHLGIPGMLMMCAEWWTYELGGFLAGLISEVELGSQSVVLELANVAYMFPIGFSGAGAVRVGNALGAGDTALAKLSAKLSIACAVSVSVCLAVIIGCSKDVISYIFSNDEQIRERVSTVMVLYAPFHLLDATAAAAGSIVKALGKHKFGAAGNLIGFYGIGFPIGASLMFAAKMGIFGLWTGLLISVFLQTVFFLVLLIKLNWVKATEEAQERAGVEPTETENAATVEQAEEVEPTEGGSHSDKVVLTANPFNLIDSTVGKTLPLRVLLVRRGLTLLAMLTILIVGLVIYATVKR